jgi:hypothetical protein
VKVNFTSSESFDKDRKERKVCEGTSANGNEQSRTNDNVLQERKQQGHLK